MSNLAPNRVELTLRECLLVDAIESANDIEVNNLKARIKELETALKPFAATAEIPGALSLPDDAVMYAWMSDCRRARSALEKPSLLPTKDAS